MAGKNPAVQQYLDSLLMEIRHYGTKFGQIPIQSIFFGGGTPSILPVTAIHSIMDEVHKAFKIAPKAEITLEANPESLTGNSNFKEYLSCGINRLSIGIQSLDDNILKMLGRPHKARDSMEAIFAARNAGFTNLSVDLINGLPNQSVRQWLQTLKDITRLEPDHISAYGLTIEPGTRLEKECESGKLVLPPERDQSIMYLEGAALLESKGYLQYEISNFSRMGFQCRHNLGYWEGAKYLGLGPSSTSTIGNRRWTNPANINSWSELVKKSELGRNPEILNLKTRVLELIMLRLRTARGLRLKAYRDLTGLDFTRDNQKLLQTLHENGLARIRNGYLSLTRQGMLVSNAVIGNIFERVNEILDKNLVKNNALGATTTNPRQPEVETAEIPAARSVIWPVADKKTAAANFRMN